MANGRSNTSRLRFAAWIVAFVILLAVAWILWSIARRKPEAASPRLDPEPFRARIVALETALFSDAPAEFGEGERIEELAAELATDLVAGPPSTLRRKSAWEVLEFGAKLGAIEDAGYATLDRAAARAEWLAIRDRTFRPAEWFRREPPEAPTPPRPSVDPRELEALDRSLRDLEALLDEGEREAMAIGEIAVDVPETGPEASALEREWLSWARRWDERVRTAGERVRTASSTGQVEAVQDVEAALRELLLVPVSGSDFGVPFRSERENRFRSARVLLARARARVSSAGED